MSSQHTHKIQLLPAAVITQIAAGQVVDRPVSVLKELIENALDAGAAEILVRLKKGGLEEIIVHDTGSGIPAKELLLAVAPHATSKLRTVQDLTQLNSFGFRGEALASIRAVAALEIQSRTATAEFGMVLKSHETEVQPIGMSMGTRVRVSELFRAHPARKKFLRTLCKKIETLDL